MFILVILINFGAFFNTFLSMKIFLIICFYYCLLCRRGNKNFDIQFRLIRPVYFPSKGGKDAVSKEEMDGEVFFSRQSRHTSFVIIMIKVRFPYFVPSLGM